ncbi:MAG: hypothetical protein EAZ57_04220 [Cytophagales bacterium]|nr:MAG: hypothetical protein EAZ67_05240 [Cytophagales bacterium]TAF61204.1 MAG: hypothetical protein EAZ57_04220 [Cytophagales bacterium]
MTVFKNYGLMALLLCGLMLYAGSCREKEEEPSVPIPLDSTAFCRGYDALDFPSADQFRIALQNRTWWYYGARIYDDFVKDTIFRRNSPGSITMVFQEGDSAAFFEKTMNWDTRQLYMKRVGIYKYEIKRNEWGKFCAEFTSKLYDDIEKDTILFRRQSFLCSSGEQLIFMFYRASIKEPSNWKYTGNHLVYYLVK